MKLSQVAAQLYTLREFCKTEGGLAETARQVREIGYEAVQVSGIGPIEPATVRTIMSDHGLAICATHESPDLIRHEPLRAVERLKTFGAVYTAFPYPSGVDFRDPAAIKAMVSDLESAGAVFRQNGCVLAYHNHAIEFCRLGEETVLDYIERATSPENLVFELDTYWVQFGGGDPAAWSGKCRGRLPALHLKDFGFGADNKPFFAELGSGNLDFRRIIPAAEASGCQWFIVEQDICPGDPFESIRKSFEYLKTFC